MSRSLPPSGGGGGVDHAQQQPSLPSSRQQQQRLQATVRSALARIGGSLVADGGGRRTSSSSSDGSPKATTATSTASVPATTTTTTRGGNLDDLAEQLRAVKNAIAAGDAGDGSSLSSSSSSSSSSSFAVDRDNLAMRTLLHMAAKTLEAHLFQQLLAAAKSIPEAQLYWRETELSNWKTAVHVVEMLPQRTFRFGQFLASEASAMARSSIAAASTTTTRVSIFSLMTQSYRAHSSSVWSFLASDVMPQGASRGGGDRSRGVAAAGKHGGTGDDDDDDEGDEGEDDLSTLVKVFPILDIARWSMQRRLARLEKTQAVIGGCIGVLFESMTTTTATTTTTTPSSSSSTTASTTSSSGDAKQRRHRSKAQQELVHIPSIDSIDDHLRMLWAVRHRIVQLHAWLDSVSWLPSSSNSTASTGARYSQPLPVPTPPASRAALVAEATAAGATTVDEQQQRVRPPPLAFASHAERVDWLLEVSSHAAQARVSLALRASVAATGVPGRATRLWVPVAATAAAGLLVSTQVGGVSAAAAAVRRGAADLWRTCLAFVGDWVLEPLRGIYNTIRHREERLALMGKDSLKGDLDSLERMVVSFARDHGATDEAELARVAAAVQHGDLTAVLQNYEDEIRRPFRNTVAGDLVRSVLIQVQKAKVDLELAMSALDKLLRANELNFAFLAVVPALLLTYTAVRQGVRLAVRVLRGPQRRSFALVRSGLREVERLLNRANRTTTTTATASSGSSSDRLTLVELGLLVCEIQTLRGCVGQMPRSARGAFREDLAELGDPAWSVSQRLATCRRMYRTYPYVWGEVAVAGAGAV